MQSSSSQGARLALGLGLAAALLAAWLLARDPAPHKILGLYGDRQFMLLAAALYVIGWGLALALSRAPARTVLVRFATVSATLVGLFAVLELAAAVGVVDWRQVLAAPQRTTRFRDWRDPRWWRLDPELLHVRPPNLHIEGRAAGDLTYRLAMAGPRNHVLDVRYDARGLRNPPGLEHAPVVVVGDSFVEGALVGPEQVVTHVLGERLGCDVINLGTSDYGPQQELVVLRRHGLEPPPRVVVWCLFGGNDLHDAARFERRRERWDAVRALHAPRRARSFSRALLAGLRSLSKPLEVEPGVWGRERAGLFRPSETSLTPTTLYFGYPSGPLGEEQRAGLALAQASVLAAAQESAEVGAAFLFVYTPTKFEVYGELCEPGPGSLLADWRPSGLAETWREWCVAHDVPFLDLTPALTAAALRGPLVYFDDDSHWSPRGHAVAAAEIAVELVRAGWLSE